MKRNTIIEICASLLVMLFIYASLSKLFEFPEYVRAMNNQPLPLWSKPILLWSIPAAELAISGLLLFKRSRLWGFYGSAALMAAFTIYISLGMWKVFDKVPCTCGGVIKNLTWPQHFVFNLFFLLAALVGIIVYKDLFKKRRLADYNSVIAS
jgi:hypothetical protein